MGGGGFSGDGSVQWEVFGDNVRKHYSQKVGAKGRKQTGVDETDAGKKFTILIQDSAEQDPNPPDGFIKYTLPIQPAPEGSKDYQIRIEWESKPGAVAKGASTPSATSRAKVKRTTGRKAKSRGRRR
jgi:hypothetical protein